jgi:hypothetical protein
MGQRVGLSREPAQARARVPTFRWAKKSPTSWANGLYTAGSSGQLCHGGGRVCSSVAVRTCLGVRDHDTTLGGRCKWTVLPPRFYRSRMGEGDRHFSRRVAKKDSLLLMLCSTWRGRKASTGHLEDKNNKSLCFDSDPLQSDQFEDPPGTKASRWPIQLTT